MKTLTFKNSENRKMTVEILTTEDGLFIDSLDGDLEGGYWSSIEVIKSYFKENGFFEV